MRFKFHQISDYLGYLYKTTDKHNTLDNKNSSKIRFHQIKGKGKDGLSSDQIHQ